MMDITRDEFWEVNYKEKEKENFIKKTVRKNKFLSISMLIFGICIIANVALIYNFFKIIQTMHV